MTFDPVIVSAVVGWFLFAVALAVLFVALRDRGRAWEEIRGLRAALLHSRHENAQIAEVAEARRRRLTVAYAQLANVAAALRVAQDRRGAPLVLGPLHRQGVDRGADD